MRSDEFFAYARERHAVYLRRAGGLPRSQWTQDLILQQYRFTNVFRELDATTVWFRENVRDPLHLRPEVLLATVLFRWFNRIVTGEAIFTQSTLLHGASCTPWQAILNSDGDDARSELSLAIRAYCGRGPYVTGAYIIKTPNGMDKLHGVLWCVHQFMTQHHSLYDGYPDTNQVGWRLAADKMLAGQITLETAWAWLRQFPYMGDFMAYEVVTDLRHTALLDCAPDIMTWANPGPGAMRGLNRLHGRPLGFRQPKAKFIFEMQDLLALSQSTRQWPQHGDMGQLLTDGYHFGEYGWSAGPWPAWEMRDVEHTLCEWDKYERARLGEGRPRGVYR